MKHTPTLAAAVVALAGAFCWRTFSPAKCSQQCSCFCCRLSLMPSSRSRSSSSSSSSSQLGRAPLPQRVPSFTQSCCRTCTGSSSSFPQTCTNSCSQQEFIHQAQLQQKSVHSSSRTQQHWAAPCAAVCVVLCACGLRCFPAKPLAAALHPQMVLWRQHGSNAPCPCCCLPSSSSSSSSQSLP